MPTGIEMLQIAREHVGEQYVFGAPVPKDNSQWSGPWDCAEFVSWCIYQVSQKLYGCNNDSCSPATADAYTGYWGRDVGQLGIKVSVEQAAATSGALVLRNPGEKCGHIVISDGNGGTIEAHSTARGVVTDFLANRRWDTGILIPWLDYAQPAATPEVPSPAIVYRVKTPLMSGDSVTAIQEALEAQGYSVGGVDGVYGPHTAAAVAAFQLANDLLADGEVGALTAAALGVVLA
jgi:hypothetical protein